MAILSATKQFEKRVVLHMKTNRLHIWELALLGAMVIGLLTAVWAQKTQAEVADELVRLHVLAKDDTDYEQSVKLQVRDRYWNMYSPCCRVRIPVKRPWQYWMPIWTAFATRL